MLNKMLSALVLGGLIGLAAYVVMKEMQVNSHINAFIARGPRFTAQDGQALCERVRVLEQNLSDSAKLGKSVRPAIFLINEHDHA